MAPPHNGQWNHTMDNGAAQVAMAPHSGQWHHAMDNGTTQRIYDLPERQTWFLIIISESFKCWIHVI